MYTESMTLKPEYLLYYDILIQLFHCFDNMMKLMVNILQNIYELFLLFLHAAHLLTRLTGVRPAIDLSWKSLL